MLPEPERFDVDNPTLSIQPDNYRDATGTTHGGFSSLHDGRAPDSNSGDRRNDYILQFPFNSGGTGEIWQAVQTSLQRVVAVKRLQEANYERYSSDPMRLRAMLGRFQEEARITASLEHPNIVPVYDYDRDDRGRPLLAMKLVNGTPWARQLRDDLSNLDYNSYLSRHLPILLAMMQAVDFAHSRGIIHLDLKPIQVMVGEFGEVLLMDWGLALSLDRLPMDGRLSQPAGTPVMMAPEQACLDGYPVGIHTDIYLLGGTLYHLLTGKFPHEATNTPMAMELLRSGKVTPPQQVAPELPIPFVLADLAMRALAYNPADRLQSVRQFRREVQDYLGGAASRLEAENIVLEVISGMNAIQGSLGRTSDAMDDPSLSSQPELTSQLEVLYARLSDFLSRLTYAEGLWRGVEGLITIRRRTLLAYLGLARHAGDLRLARTLAAQLEQAGDRDHHILQIERDEARIRRRALALRISLFSAIALIFVVAVGSIRYALDTEKLNREVAGERDDANQARAAMERALRIAFEERGRADEARDFAVREQYISAIHLAAGYLREGRLRDAERLLLERTPAEHRSAEWGVLAAKLALDEMALYRADAPERLLHADYSPDGTLIATGDNSGFLCIWDANSGTLLRHTRLSSRGLWTITFTPNGELMLVTGFEGTGWIIETATLAVRHTLTGHQRLLRGGAISPDGRLAITTSPDRTARIWSMETGEEVLSVPSIPSGLYAAAFAPDGRTFVLAGTIYVTIRDTATGNIIHRLLNHRENVLGVAYSPDGKLVATACTDRFLRVYNAEDGSMLHEINNVTSWLQSVRFSPDGKQIATSDNNGMIRLWDVATGAKLNEFQSYPQAFKLAFNPEGTRIVTTSATQITVWNLERLRRYQQLPALTRTKLDLDPQTTVVLRAYGLPLEYGVGRSERWDEPGHFVFEASDLESRVLAHSFFMAPTPDGEQCLWITPNLLTAVLRSTATWQVLHDFGPRKYYRFEWLKQGRQFLAVALDGQTTIWDRETMQPVRELLPAETEEYISGHHPGTTTVSADGRFAAVAKSDGRVFVWDVESHELVHSYQYPEGIPSFIRISPNSDLIAVGGESFRVRIWERESGNLVSRATGHEGLVMGAVFSEDQSRLLTWSRDDRVRLFETSTGRELVTVAVFTDGETVVGAAFSSDETEIYAMSSRLNLYAYPIMPNLGPMTEGKSFETIATEFEALKRSINRGVLVTPEQLDWKGPPEKFTATIP